MAIAWPFGKTRQVRNALAGYPPLVLANAGKGADLTKAQREENLARFLVSRSDRLALLRKTVAGLGYPLPESTMTPEAVEAASLVFHRLSHDHLIGWKLAVRGLDRRRPPDPGAAGLDGFGRDIGAYLADAAITLRPALGWAIGRVRNMPTFGEIVIAVDTAKAPELSHFEQDPLAIGSYILFDVANTGAVFNRPNAFHFAVDFALGRYEMPKPPR